MDKMLPEAPAVSPPDIEQAGSNSFRKSSSPPVSSNMKSRSKFDSGNRLVGTSKPIIPTIDLRAQKKPLRPVPQLSPSTFRPHLPASTLSQYQDDPIEMDGPPSSIESFGSPEKKSVDSRKLESIRNWGEDGDETTERSRDTILTDDQALRARGQELVDMRQMERALKREKNKSKRPLSEVIKRAGMEPESQPELEREEESIIVQEMEDAYVDLSGGGDDWEGSQVLPVPQEEEESTQDLELEKQRLAAEKGVQQNSVGGLSVEQEITVRLSFN